MKRFMICLATAVFAVGSFAQNVAKTQKTPEEIATQKADKLKSELGLSDEQRTKIYAIILDNTTQVRAVEAKHPNDKEAAKKEIKPLLNQCDASIKSVLTPDQATKWEQLKKEKKEEHKEKKKTEDKGKKNHNH